MVTDVVVFVDEENGIFGVQSKLIWYGSTQTVKDTYDIILTHNLQVPLENIVLWSSIWILVGVGSLGQSGVFSFAVRMLSGSMMLNFQYLGLVLIV